jgi:hypothetical protein
MKPELEMFVGVCGPRKAEESQSSFLGVIAHSQIRNLSTYVKWGRKIEDLTM